MNISKTNNHTLRIRIGIGVTLIGFLIFLLGADPGMFNLDRSPVVGFVQSATFSFGLAIVCLGGVISLKACQQTGKRQSIAQDIGLRLVATGFLIALISAMADVFGFGTQAWPDLPFFGPWQAAGVVVGEIFIAVGFILFIPYPGSSPDA